MLQTSGNKIIVPNGETYLLEGDKVVILKQEQKKAQIKNDLVCSMKII